MNNIDNPDKATFVCRIAGIRTSEVDEEGENNQNQNMGCQDFDICTKKRKCYVQTKTGAG